MKRLSGEAYQALREALAAIYWNRKPFETYLRASFRDQPELLAGLNFNEPKRAVADALVDRLIQQDTHYQDVTLRVMQEIASMREFPNIERIKDEEDRAYRVGEATVAVAHLARLMSTYTDLLSAQEHVASQREAYKAQVDAQRRLSDEIDDLKQRYVSLQSSAETPQQRGHEFEKLLNSLFVLFDMEPRLAYSLPMEQIDGALTFDTDDYIIEAKWHKEPIGRSELDIFATKVRRKGKNALGLFISVSGFTSDATVQYDEATSFIAVDGGDLYLVLDQRIPLDDLIKAKRRHANETGSCFISGLRLI